MLQQRSWLYAVLVLAGGLIGGAVSAQFAPSVAMAPRRWGGLFTDSSRESLDRGTRWRSEMNSNSRSRSLGSKSKQTLRSGGVSGPDRSPFEAPRIT